MSFEETAPTRSPTAAPTPTECEVLAEAGSSLGGLAAGAAFGSTVSLADSANVLAVGAPFANSDDGLVRVYAYDGAAWSQLGADLLGTSSDAEKFGQSVALSGDGTTLAVGAPSAPSPSPPGSPGGVIRVWGFDGSAWSLVGAQIEADAAGDRVGGMAGLALNDAGDVVAFGARQSDYTTTNVGMVRVYAFDGSAWGPRGTGADLATTGTWIGGATHDKIGYSVALDASGDVMAFGARMSAGNGFVKVYEYDSGTTTWSQRGARLDGGNGELFSASIALNVDGSVVAVGANLGNGGAGLAAVYEFDGSAWNQLGDDIDGDTAGDDAGASIALDSTGYTLLVGEPGYDADAGRARLYAFDGSAWTQQGDDLSLGGASSETGGTKGSGVALNAAGSLVAVGAPGYDSGAGLARAYAVSTCDDDGDRRLASDSYGLWDAPAETRRLSGVYGPGACPAAGTHDPCDSSKAIFGDINGDERFDGQDVEYLVTFNLLYKVFAETGSSNPFDASPYDEVCAHRRWMMNPNFDLLPVDDPADPRYGMPNIDQTDADILSKASQFHARFLEIDFACASPSDGAGNVTVTAWLGYRCQRVKATDVGNVGTDVYLEYLAGPNGTADQSYTVNVGSLGSAASREVAFPALAGNLQGANVVPEYFENAGVFKAQAEPEHWPLETPITYYVAVGVASYQDFTTAVEGRGPLYSFQDYVGVSFHPFGRNGNVTTPVIGHGLTRSALMNPPWDYDYLGTSNINTTCVGPPMTPTPTAAPTAVPSFPPTAAPTETPTLAPSGQPSFTPTMQPFASVEPTLAPVTPAPSPDVVCPEPAKDCEDHCFKVICKDGRRYPSKCLVKGYTWFEARDYTDPGNVAGCAITKTAYGVGGCYEVQSAARANPLLYRRSSSAPGSPRPRDS